MHKGSISFLRYIKLRMIKKVQLRNRKNISIGAHSGIFKYSILNATDGEITLGNHVRIGNSSELTTSLNSKITVKDHSSMYSNCKLLGQITIERYALLATNIYMSSGNHYAFDQPELPIKIQDQIVLKDPVKRQHHHNPIHIHEDVWIGNGVFISPGVTIGRGAIIGTGAIVTKNVAPYSVMVGAPAKKIKVRLSFQPPSSISCSSLSDFPYFYCGFDHFEAPETIHKNGFLLIDQGICKLETNGKTIVVSGISNEAATIKLEVNDTSKEFKLSNGEFSLAFEHQIADTELELKLNTSNLSAIRILTITQL